MKLFSAKRISYVHYSPHIDSTPKILKECPFNCKPKLLSIHNENYYHDDYYYIECATCNARGPIANTEKGAIAYWNERKENLK